MCHVRTGNLVCHAFAALAFAATLSHSETAAASDFSTAVASIHSTRSLDDMLAGAAIARDAFLVRYVASVIPSPTSVCNAQACSRRAVAAGDSTSVSTASAAGFQAPITWQQDFRVAGLRAWTKVIKFSSHGINIRLPLN